MGLELRQQLKMTQQLVMTPQLQQAIKLLQLNHLELAELIGNEIVENPVLEELHEEREDPLAKAGAKEEKAKPEDPNAEGNKDQTDIDWERYLDDFQSSRRTGAEIRRDFDDLPGYDQTLTRGQSLSEHVMWQLQMAAAPEEERAAAAAIVGNLGPDGYLRIPIEEMAEARSAPLELFEDALALVQSLDPLGVGARNLQECLLIQARVNHPDDRVLRAVIEDHMDRVEKRDYKPIARKLGVSYQRVIDAVRTLAEMEPKPGREYGNEEARYITPDIYVIKSGDEYIIQLNEDGVPRLRVSSYYRQVLTGAAKGDKEYIQDKLRSAQWLIRSIYQRQRTIYKVTESIVKQQRGFFDNGIKELKPMILRDVAEDISMHESTVSRVTSNKYVHTHHGIFPLKFFFNSSIQRDDGDSVASEMVKQRIKAIIGDENPRKPYSDQKVVQLLGEENIKIARRTVAKYRDMLGIASSSQRKRLF
ncbi:MAG TPA: RNA polymerase sigma-54 factor [Deltaproteobacteria bacterium]|nr:RNA polymerase sigma-54 factor [Deltaproteobacteria bacterium]HCP46199.1 RNA polymerase sigma-54 factor [Deltaproteobacteria bacterium]